MRRLAALVLLAAGPLIVAALGGANRLQAEQIDRQFRECTVCPVMVAIPSGDFVMGSPRGEPGRFDSEGPQHRVTIRAFALGQHDVTSEEFLTFLRETGYQPLPCDPRLNLGWHSPGHGLAYAPGISDPRLWPASCLNWRDAKAYIAWLNGKVRGLPSAAISRHGRLDDGPYRLPTEAEWEYAARAGTRAARWWGAAIGSDHANCDGCGSAWDGRLLAPVGSFGPNAFGLYDMLGNVWQWVEDCWHENYVGAPDDGSAWLQGDCRKHVLRGGSWSNVPIFVRAASRIGADTLGTDSDWSNYAGFRVARTLP
ncbi:MAG TPA: formylglycine-generating enzyme family protein [Terriglobia bacterium]|nr:formylglycine-generating enzyme family protein [Terriglobia bacterium]